jgi:glycosyltransferase involved in cell wall biosynthesis
MSTTPKPTLALVSNYGDESCGFAAYTRARETGFSDFFKVTVFDLKSSTLMRPPGHQLAADKWIDVTCSELPKFDLVVLDFEFGMWGTTLEQCERRILKCCRAAQRLLLVVDRVDIDKTKDVAFALAQAKIFQDVARRPADRPYHLFTHGHEEMTILRSLHGFREVSHHPIAVVTAPDRAELAANTKTSEWKQNLGFDDSAIVIGLFGTLSKYKDARTVVRALRYLPDHYKLVLVGGAHPFSVRPFLPDDNITDLLETIAEVNIASPHIEERIRFAGVLSDRHFREAMQHCDYVVLPYHDAGQLTSGVASNSFELGKRMVGTRTKMFHNFRKTYGDCFETYDVGNYLELRDKLKFFDPEKAQRMELAKDLYTPKSLAAHVYQIALDLKRDDFRNYCDMEKIDDLARSFETVTAPSSTKERVSPDSDHLQRAFTEAVQVQNQLKAEKQASEEELARSRQERDRLVHELSTRHPLLNFIKSFWSLLPRSRKG